MRKTIQGESIHSKIKEIGIKYYKNRDKYKQIKVICLKTNNKKIQKSSYIVFTTKSWTHRQCENKRTVEDISHFWAYTQKNWKQRLEQIFIHPYSW